MVRKSDGEELSTLRAENARLISLLETNGIEWRLQQQILVQKLSTLSTDDKVALSEIAQEDISRLSPLMHGHINMLGYYSLTPPENVMNGDLRPLNQQVNEDIDV